MHKLSAHKYMIKKLFGSYKIVNSNESWINKDIPIDKQFKFENNIYYFGGIGCEYSSSKWKVDYKHRDHLHKDMIGRLSTVSHNIRYIVSQNKYRINADIPPN